MKLSTLAVPLFLDDNSETEKILTKTVAPSFREGQAQNVSFPLKCLFITMVTNANLQDMC